MYRYATDLSCTLQFTSLSRAGFPRGLSTSATINWIMPFRSVLVESPSRYVTLSRTPFLRNDDDEVRRQHPYVR